jgi:flagellar biosynthesis/type III secretory pathway protein FliH
MKDTATQPANENNNVMNETKKLTAEERQQMETFIQKVRQKDIPVIEAAHTILRNRDSYAQNQVNAYKDGLRKEIAEAYDDGYEDGYRISLERIKELEDELEVKEIIIGEYRNLRAEFLKGLNQKQ